MEEKKKKGSWEPQSLRTAIDKVMSKELSVRQAAMQYNIPKSTIHDKIKALNRGEEVTMKPKLGKFTSTFSAEYEQVLVDHIKDLSNRCMPLMKKEFLKLAYDLAEVMKIPHRFNKEKGSADGHCSHKTLAVISFCRENHIHLISSPPHTTHKLQPLDRTFMKPFKDAYSQRCDLWMRTNAGCRITDYDIAGLVKEAFIKVARLDIAVSGFKCTGIHPFDRHLFSDLDYLAADMTNIPLEQTETSSNPLNNEQAVVISNSIIEEQIKESEQSISEPITTSPKPSTSSAPDLVQIIHNLSPLPDAAKKTNSSSKKKE
ncbi:unnamed protein product [Danaus chrysippus]|uniref:(African queen) hypothetical protein n=1 Tax=Danaus chrysippus TaxID=151541 RepID=A0A8J2VR50_9NEOP|nr:unnamed protein product [Danaus chrysippus]